MGVVCYFPYRSSHCNSTSRCLWGSRSVPMGIPPEARIIPCAGAAARDCKARRWSLADAWRSPGTAAPSRCECGWLSPTEHASGCGTFSSPRTSKSAPASQQTASPPIGPRRTSGQPSGRAPPTAAKHAPQNGQAQLQG